MDPTKTLRTARTRELFKDRHKALAKVLQILFQIKDMSKIEHRVI